MIVLRTQSNVFMLLGVGLAAIVFVCQLWILSEPDSSLVASISDTSFDQVYVPTIEQLNFSRNVVQMDSMRHKSSNVTVNKTIFAPKVRELALNVKTASASSLSNETTEKESVQNNAETKERVINRHTELKPLHDVDKVDSAVDQGSEMIIPKKNGGLSETNGNRWQSAPIDIGSSDGLVNVVSMSLYGSNPRYVQGAVRNAQLIRHNFPGWQLWIYVESSESSRYGTVPPHIIAQLVELGAEIHYVTPDDDFVPPMMWRFLVADDPAVNRFIIRDVDSRLTQRDVAAVSQWIRSGLAFHCVRDHPSHAGYAVSGGLWGGKAPELRSILRRSWATMMRGVAPGYLNDMNFLNEIVWPRVSKHAICTDSVSCDRWPGAVPFPVVRHGYEHIGQVYSENDVAREVDIKILRRTAVNVNCVSQVVIGG